jgi:hypothetical protein
MSIAGVRPAMVGIVVRFKIPIRTIWPINCIIKINVLMNAKIEERPTFGVVLDQHGRFLDIGIILLKHCLLDQKLLFRKILVSYV